jgi:hypothetical protein
VLDTAYALRRGNYKRVVPGSLRDDGLAIEVCVCVCVCGKCVVAH